MKLQSCVESGRDVFGTSRVLGTIPHHNDTSDYSTAFWSVAGTARPGTVTGFADTKKKKSAPQQTPRTATR